MRPIEFEGADTTYGGEDLFPLPVQTIHYSDGSKAFVSCWKLTLLEKLRLLLGSRLYLIVLADRHPPVFLTSYKSVAVQDFERS